MCESVPSLEDLDTSLVATHRNFHITNYETGILLCRRQESEVNYVTEVLLPPGRNLGWAVLRGSTTACNPRYNPVNL